MRGARRTVCATLVALCAGTGPADAATPVGLRCKPDTRPKATVLLFHPGAWIYGNAWMLDRECAAFARHGFDVLSVGYPLRDYFGALRAAERAVRWRRGRRVYAIGWSAGGNMSAMLAVRGQVRAAVAIAAPTNLLTWADESYYRDVLVLSRRERRLASPLYRYQRNASPLLLMHSPADEVVPYSQSVALARRARRPLVRLRGPHLRDRSATGRSLRWIEGDLRRR